MIWEFFRSHSSSLVSSWIVACPLKNVTKDGRLISPGEIIGRSNKSRLRTNDPPQWTKDQTSENANTKYGPARACDRS